jgi:hypothetical protein
MIHENSKAEIASERDAAASPHLRIDRCHEAAPLTSLTPRRSIVIPFPYNPNKRERERETSGLLQKLAGTTDTAMALQRKNVDTAAIQTHRKELWTCVMASFHLR